MPTPRTLVATGAVAILATGLGGCRHNGFADTEARTASTGATAWLRDQQLADGSFELAGFPGFETPDAVIAIAEEAQTGGGWSQAEALAAVEATVTGGHDPLDVLDDQADGALNAGTAAKLTVLVALPLGLSPTSFDPQGDGGRDLLAAIDAGLQPSGSYGTFGATLMAAIAKKAASQTVPATTVAHIRAAQKADGSWDYLGDPSGTGSDIDTTAQGVTALVAAGLREDDPDLHAGLSFLAERQSATGAWQSYGTDDPNATAMATMAVSGAGYDPRSECWRNLFAPAKAGDPYVSPTAWLVDQQAEDGHLTSPNDGWGLNTFATSQGIQALRRQWMPATSIMRSC